MSKKAAKAGVLGAILGALAGIFLLAPKGAKENREDVKQAVIKGKAEAEKRLKEAYGQLGELSDELKKRGSKLSDAAKKESKDLLKQADELQIKIKNLIANVRDDAADIASDVDDAIAESQRIAKKLKDLAGQEIKSAAKSIK